MAIFHSQNSRLRFYHWSEYGYIGAGILTALVIFLLLFFIISFSLPVFFSGYGHLLLDWRWQPDAGYYGILPMLVGSLLLSISTLLLSFPLVIGICAALCGVGHFPRTLIFNIVRFMTGIPTVVYGFASIFLLTPLLQRGFGGSGFSWLAAMLIMTLLVLPTMVLIIDAGIQGITQGEGNRVSMNNEVSSSSLTLAIAALGLTPLQGFVHIILPAARRWLLAGGLLGFSRAIGDTLIPLMLAGNAAQVPLSMLDSIRTLTAHIVLAMAGEIDGPVYVSLFAAGGVLLVTSIVIQGVLRRVAATPSNALLTSIVIRPR